MRCLLLHVPSRHDGVNEIMVMPMGLFSIAGALHHAGHVAGMVHLGLEQDLDPALTLEELLRRARPDILFVPMHWARQIRPVIDLCRDAKQLRPRLPVVLGGFSASFFAREILEACPFVDGVVRGDGEGPAVDLADALAAGRSLEDVPNLTWRDRGVLRENPGTFHLSPMLAEDLDHACFPLLLHHAEYLSRCLYADFDTSTLRGASHRYDAAFFYNPGRGCPYACTYCGGTWWARTQVDSPRGFWFFSPKKALRDIARAHHFGARSLRISWDPAHRREYYISLFEGLRGLGMRLVFDAFSLPDARFLRAAAGAFRGDSILVISAECGNEEVRRRNRGVPFSNRALLDALRRVDDAGLQGHVFLSAGLPFETPAMVNETEALIGRILTSTRAAVTVCPMDLDPGSRLFLEPEALGVTPFLRTFRDFYEDGYTEPRPHYATAHMTEAEILAAVHRLTAAVHGLGG